MYFLVLNGNVPCGEFLALPRASHAAARHVNTTERIFCAHPGCRCRREWPMLCTGEVFFVVLEERDCWSAR